MQDKKDEPKGLAIQASVSTTSCRQCIFAQYNDDNEQVNCAAGRFEVFEENGVDLMFVGDEEKKFFLVKDKACAYFRHQDQFAEIAKEQSVEEILDDVKASLKIPYHAIVFLRPARSSASRDPAHAHHQVTTSEKQSQELLEQLKERLDELDRQDVKPAIVTVIDRTHSEIDLTPKIVGLFHNEYSFANWRTQRVQSVDQSDMGIIDVCYDNVKSKKYFFYTTFEVTKPISLSFSEEIHHSIQEKMQSFVILEADEGHGKTVLKIAHAKYGGNSFDIDLKDKLVHYNDGVDLIRKVEELCPSLKVS